MNPITSTAANSNDVRPYRIKTPQAALDVPGTVWRLRAGPTIQFVEFYSWFRRIEKKRECGELPLFQVEIIRSDLVFCEWSSTQKPL